MARGRPRLYPDIQATWREGKRRWRQAQRDKYQDAPLAPPEPPGVPVSPTPARRPLPPRHCPTCGQQVVWLDVGTAYRCGWSGCRCLWDG